MSNNIKKCSAISVKAETLRRIRGLEKSKSPLKEWLSKSEYHKYVGRRCHYVEGADQSEYHNPFTVKKTGLNTCLDLYKNHLQTKLNNVSKKSLLDCAIEEFGGKPFIFGCFCPQSSIEKGLCHASVLANLVNDGFQKKINDTKQPVNDKISSSSSSSSSSLQKNDKKRLHKEMIEEKDEDSDNNNKETKEKNNNDNNITKQNPKRLKKDDNNNNNITNTTNTTKAIIEIDSKNSDSDTNSESEIIKKNIKTKIIKISSQIFLKLPTGGTIKYVPQYLTKEEGDILFKHLIDSKNWAQGEYKIFGKPMKTPRLLWAMKDEKTNISNSYSLTGSTVWSEEVKNLRDKLSKYLNKTLTYAQMNYYRSGKDYVSWHSDQECQKDDIIASISLGETRKFCFKNKNDKSIPKYEFELKHCDLIVMDYESSNEKWKHTVPKQNDVKNPRINITFRVK
eukprot:c8318_g1_i1.p1 GENE.c8318_g1_i1~~c8318_g1_i1.p1  ORF type:complete len:451 (-),score=159.68 c8318_g1_i1:70-1422(-)